MSINIDEYLKHYSKKDHTHKPSILTIWAVVGMLFFIGYVSVNPDFRENKEKTSIGVFFGGPIIWGVTVSVIAAETGSLKKHILK